MPKKSTAARSGVQRSNKPKQKGFELVRPEGSVVEETRSPQVEEVVSVNGGTATTVMTTEAKPERRSSARTAIATVPSAKSKELNALPTVPAPRSTVAPDESDVPVATVPKATPTAASRLAARRQNGQKIQQRNAASLITAEHFSYVRRDLLFIAILALIMFTTIIVLYFTIGRA